MGWKSLEWTNRLLSALLSLRYPFFTFSRESNDNLAVQKDRAINFHEALDIDIWAYSCAISIFSLAYCNVDTSFNTFSILYRHYNLFLLKRLVGRCFIPQLFSKDWCYFFAFGKRVLCDRIFVLARFLCAHTTEWIIWSQELFCHKQYAAFPLVSRNIHTCSFVPDSMKRF